MSQLGPEWLTLTETARLFRADHRTIKSRCLKGDFVYEVTPNGFWHISRQSVTQHLGELDNIHTREGNVKRA
jgi:hypothetical protein